MNQKLTFRELKTLLDRSAAALDRPTLDGLARARTSALQRQRTPATGWLHRNGLLHAFTHEHPALGRYALPVCAALLIGAIAWWSHQPDHDPSDIDLAILTDDMPVHVFFDE